MWVRPPGRTDIGQRGADESCVYSKQRQRERERDQLIKREG